MKKETHSRRARSASEGLSDGMLPFRRLPRWRFGLVILALAAPVAVRGEEIRPSFLMFTDPELIVPAPRRVIDAELIALWRQALQRPEVDYQRLAAEAVARAHRLGCPGMDAARPELLQVLTAKESHPVAVKAAALALIELGSRDTAPVLFQAAQQRGIDLAFHVEPALAQWKYEPIYSVWRTRLGDANSRRRELLLAVDGAGLVGDVEALPLLTNLVRTIDRPADVRLAAARAAGIIAPSGLESLAAELTAARSPQLTDRLCAASLLAQHTSDAAQSQLMNLARDAEPAVAAAALQTLLAVDAQRVLPLVEELLKNPDAKVRLAGVEAYVVLPNTERIGRLVRVLLDRHPDVRGRAWEGLFAHAKTDEFGTRIRDLAGQLLAEDDWRGQEQAALLLAALDHRPAAGRLVELLESPKPQVMVASAWGLRVLAVPETAPALLDKARRETELRINKTWPDDAPAHDLLLAHLFEAFVRLDYVPAAEIMRRYVRKDFGMGDFSRGAAIWSLGHLQHGTPDDRLAAELMERAKDYLGMFPDTELVRRMSSISIGRMKALSQLGECRTLLDQTADGDIVDQALRWTIHELTGEAVPPPEPPIAHDGPWFLTPVRKPMN